ncbi:MAG: hypothetical protein H6565_11955 [Lewinellaceae bacterium]|nr:hypothetical protein [Saprospiraceae bacterium]MCB9307300.1 hypothetical protein [Lewinellaceae bacterium]
MSTYTYREVIEKEQEQLKLRREKLQQEHGTDEQPDWFGIALSGGGIRSATINLGFLKTLNKFGILQKADYLSTVSGGGYTHSYVQATIKEHGDFDRLFTKEHIDAMRQHGEYLTPGQGLWKTLNTLLLAVAFVVSWLMSLISPAIVAGIIYYIYTIIVGFTGNPVAETSGLAMDIEWWSLLIAGGLILLHFVVNIALNFNLGISKQFNKFESAIAVLGLFLYGWILLSGVKTGDRITGSLLMDYGINAVLLFVLGFFTNPNALSFHRYYRKQLADLFLCFSGLYKNMLLKDVFKIDSDKKNGFLAPYPLINTCLNLQNPGGGDKFKGSKASDYFLLSPLYCGSKLTCYVRTDRYVDYRKMTLPAAVTISAAAVNPGLGMYSNKLLSVLMTLFNARLGFWTSNPSVLEKSYAIVWWPVYFFKELLGRIGLSNKMINISDGGHIENLGVYELLRRDCSLIIAVDAGEDKTYTFTDLNNLIIRARNELGLEIRFRPDEQPEDLIRPRPSQVYSKKRYAVADIYRWWEDNKVFNEETQKEESSIVNFKTPKKVGTFVYVKSSVLAPAGKPFLTEAEDRLKYGTYKYKIYHADFPHESTSDQFFDEIQWESYYQLGQYLGADVLGVSDLGAYEDKKGPSLSVDQLLRRFEKGVPLFESPAEARTAPGQDEELFESVKAPEQPVAREVKYQM